MMVYEIKLDGCTPLPLSGYLKALGILRLVSEQVPDSNASAWWEGDVFRLRSTVNMQKLIDFFKTSYSPTPIVGPWGARSGFYPGSSETSARAALEAIEATEIERLSDFKYAILFVRDLLKEHGINTKPEKGLPKQQLMQLLRATASDKLLPWLDCVYTLLDESTGFPPLLGTGGNEGSGSYTSAFAQTVVDLIINQRFDDAIESALFDDLGQGGAAGYVAGHFSPGDSDSANAGTGFSGAGTLNPWTLLLMLEGAIAFAGASVRKLGSSQGGSLSYPFCVRPAGVGYGSADLSDEGSSRSEMWMPLWSQPASYKAISHLLSEGRVDVGKRRARNGVDFARAIASVGVDRGIDSFQRFGFQQRNGLSYFAVPLGRFKVSNPTSTVGLLSGIDRWLDRFRSAAAGDRAPARAKTALRRLESAIIQACKKEQCRSTLDVLVALGSAQRAVASSPELREANYPVQPIPLLPHQWLTQSYDAGAVWATEFRLAASIASLGFSSGLKHGDRYFDDPVGPFRRHVEPIRWQKLRYKNCRPEWASQANDPAVVWTSPNLIDNLSRVLLRRLTDAVKDSDARVVIPLDGKLPASLSDVQAFIDRQVDDNLITSFIDAMILVDWQAVDRRDIDWEYPTDRKKPIAAYSLLKLCFLPHPIQWKDRLPIDVKVTPRIARRAVTGELTQATQLAAQRLRASGLPPAVDTIASNDPAMARRIAAALVFPLEHLSDGRSKTVNQLCEAVLRHDHQ